MLEIEKELNARLKAERKEILDKLAIKYKDMPNLQHELNRFELKLMDQQERFLMEDTKEAQNKT